MTLSKAVNLYVLAQPLPYYSLVTPSIEPPLSASRDRTEQLCGVSPGQRHQCSLYWQENDSVLWRINSGPGL